MSFEIALVCLIVYANQHMISGVESSVYTVFYSKRFRRIRKEWDRRDKHAGRDLSFGMHSKYCNLGFSADEVFKQI